MNHVCRPSSRFELVAFAQLGEGEREAVADLAANPDFFGVLRPRHHRALGVKSASRSLAQFIQDLSSPGSPPDLRVDGANRPPDDEIARLVLDGILEIEHHGELVSGAAAAHLLPPAPPPVAPADRLTQLSLDALTYAADLPIEEAATLSARLYFFNRLPITPRWAHRLAAPGATQGFLGLAGTELARTLEREWSFVPPEEPGGWLTWVPRELRTPRAKDAPNYKLYLSPLPDMLPETLRIVVDVLADAGPTVFKVGSEVHGILRPDKLVIYFTDPAALADASARIRHATDGIPAHGVPFTAPIDGAGLLSRGVDPPNSAKLLSWRETESWRLWVTNRLAVYLLTARATATPTTTFSPAAFATARLGLDGVDTATWFPAASWAPTKDMS